MLRPLELLQQSLHHHVLVELKEGRALRGVLEAYDQHLNLVLSQVEEVGAAPGRPATGVTLLRGDSVVFISP
ncbi:MAG: LSM domain-containing protein [Thermoplasmata archaeon]